MLTIQKGHKKIKNASPVMSDNDYLKMHFPCKDDECLVKYNSVGGNRYRINFYCYDKKASNLSSFRNMIICRSTYIILRHINGNIDHIEFED